ncbi:hypothetical protein [Streptomyces sp. NPDC005017]|uniref:hypothetical protein n=1 Tax=Streptomyces sp. NPDC005017 TaxID=3364706 RepID=UPI0036C2F798
MAENVTRRAACAGALLALGALLGPAPQGAVAATGAPDTAHMAWRGAGSDPSIYWSRLVNGQWTRQQGFPATTAREPDLAYVNGRAYMAWRGSGADNHIWWSTFNGASWSGQRVLADRRTANYPALGRGAGRLYMAWRGAGADDHIWWSSFNGSAWSGQRVLADRRTSGAPGMS